MPDAEDVIAELGNEPPLIADGRSGPPDRREVSARWLSGTFLTGVTSSVLMGVALFAALDGRQQLATPPEIADVLRQAAAGKTEPLVVINADAQATHQSVINVMEAARLAGIGRVNFAAQTTR